MSVDQHEDLPFLEDLPPDQIPTSQAKRWQVLADEMRKRPYKWRIMHRSTWRSTITSLRNGEYRAFRPPTDWEFTIKGPPGEPKVTLLGRFIGAPKPPGFEEGPQP